MATIMSCLSCMKFSKIKKFNRISGITKSRPYPHRAIQRYQPPRYSGKRISDFKVYEECGMFEDDFEVLFEKIKPLITKSRSGTGFPSTTKLFPRVRLLMILHFLREHPKYRNLAQKFGVSVRTAHREVLFILPKMYVLKVIIITYIL